MFKLLAMYDQPDDPAAFDTYYEQVHGPLARKIPGLRKLVVNRARGNPMGGDPRYYLIAELHFADKDSFQQATQSEEFQATGADLANFAAGKVTLLVVEEVES